MRAPELIAELFAVLRFAAQKHAGQRRKDAEKTPYVNHLIEVADLLARVGGVRDFDVLAAGILHDTVEDTGTTPAELETAFGPRVCALVAEVTDDKSLAKDVRKQLVIEHAPHLTRAAKQIKLADLCSNVREIGASPPAGWDLLRREEYIDWARAVVAGCRGANPELEKHFDEVAVTTETSFTTD